MKYKSKCLFLIVFLNLISTGAFCDEPVSVDSLYTINPSYEEIIEGYRHLDSLYSKARLIPYGKTDIGLPLHLFIIDKKGVFEPHRLHELGNIILFINNGIHPGEPDGINASLIWATELLKNMDMNPMMDNVTICMIPVFNIDGALNRSCCSRANQDGPPEYGFRGNAQNLDLNRDFIKCDSRNVQSLIAILRQWDPDVFLDTHVSDGADYQYTMTLISSQTDKLYPILGKTMKETLTPFLFKKMKQKGEEMTPYVDTKDYDDIPESGIRSFLELPRFASGYCSLFNTFPFIAETHMLKPFSERVRSTVKLMESILEMSSSESEKIYEARKLAKQEDISRKLFPTNWELDTNYSELINFKGYEAETKISTVTGLPQTYYNHNKPFDKKIKFQPKYIAADTISAPMYYLIPQAWYKVANNLEQSKIRLITIKADSTTMAEVIYIESYETTDSPYEGHYLHHNTKVSKKLEKVQVMKGDYLVPMFQENSRFLVETLEPVAADSYFNWGFFDAVLQQKEWFSGYVFEPVAEKLLQENPGLKKEFEDKKLKEPEFAKDSFSQLYFIYRHSPYFEKSFRRYPVIRIGTR
ncbi:MAG: hypothetical protein IPJ66_07365 [Bacteroidetes bacterium]|nr:hypothetical protein [Bacteroidota bacterium]